MPRPEEACVSADMEDNLLYKMFMVYFNWSQWKTTDLSGPESLSSFREIVFSSN